MVYGSAGQLHRVQRAGSRRHEELWKMEHVRLEETRVEGLGTEPILIPI